MKKLILNLVAIVALTGCGENKKPESYLQGKTYSDGYGSRYTIIVIDHCEYIKCSQYNGSSLTHKGNCKNPIHK